MKLTILGNNSALPAYGRHPTAQCLEISNQYILIDCGEGTQMQLQQYGIKFSRINYIFISHMHGDHFFGLIGLLNSFSLLGRARDLHIYCPQPLKAIIDLQLDHHLGFHLMYHFIQDDIIHEILVDTEKIQITCFLVSHSVPTHGFIFTEKNRKRILLPEQVSAYEIPNYYYSKLTNGEDYIRKDGTIIKNESVTADGLPNKTYVYSADTGYFENIIPYIQFADLLYHETTYLHENIEKAIARKHSTTIQAATIALKADVKKLIIGHFSSKYKDLSYFLNEASSIFKNTYLAKEGSEFDI